MKSTNDVQPWLGQGSPVYPGLYETLRVTSAISVGSNVYSGFLTQWAPPLTLRDRVEVYIWEPNGIALKVGFYSGRLIGSHNGLPLYQVDCCP